MRGEEECDGTNLNDQSCETLGFSGGLLSCAPLCTFDTSACISTEPVCGDGMVDGYEECDGADDAACPGACSAHCACPTTGAGPLEVHVIDVGQGDAILIVSPDGFVTLLDAGESGNDAAVAAALAELGLAELDYTLVSHFHSDHLGAMDAVLAAHPEVVACFDHGGSYTTTQYAEYDTAAGARRVALSRGDFVDMGPSMVAEVLSADAAASNENNGSVVLRIDYGDFSMLLGGDCESGCEAGLAMTPVDVYKVHHHGSDSASSADFLAQALPVDAIISVGADNPYGHPADAALIRLADVGAEVWRTDLQGDLSVTSDGSGYTVQSALGCTEGATQACGTSDVGACALGERTCTGGVWGACVGAVEPTDELCDNGVDDDCDGATDDGDADCAAAPASLLIVQVAYDTPGDDAIEEFVDLYNPTEADIALDGWSLSDNLGTWAFPDGYVVPAGGFFSLARDAAGFTAWFGIEPDLDGLTLALGNTGDLLTLMGPDGQEDTVAWEDALSGWSLAAPIGDSLLRTDPDVDTDSAADWSILSPASALGGLVTACGDGTCGAGEDCDTCPADCAGEAGGKPSGRFCCGDGTAQLAEGSGAICDGNF